MYILIFTTLEHKNVAFIKGALYYPELVIIVDNMQKDIKIYCHYMLYCITYVIILMCIIHILIK